MKPAWLTTLGRRYFRRHNNRTMRNRKARSGRPGLVMEPLEDRMLLSVSTVSDSNVDFHTDGQNMWDSGPAVAIHAEFSETLLAVNFTPVEIGGFVLGTGLEASFSGGFDLGLSGEFDVTAGAVAADYGTAVMVEAFTSSGALIDSSNLTAGDIFILHATESPNQAAIALETEFANISAGLFLDYGLRANASLTGKITGLGTVVNTGFNKSVSGRVELIGADLDLGSGIAELRLLGGEDEPGGETVDFTEAEFCLPLNIVCASLYVPTLNTGDPTDEFPDDSNYNVTDNEIVNAHLPVDRSQGKTRIDFFELTLGLDEIVSLVSGIPLDFSVGNQAVSIDVTLINAELQAFLGIAQEMTFTPMMMVDYNFLDGPGGNPMFVSVETSPGSGLFEPVTTKRVALGEDLAVIHGGGTLDIDLDYVLTGQFRNVTSIYLSPAFTLDVGVVELSGSLIETAQDLGILPDDLGFSLFSDIFELGDPIKLIDLFDRTFNLGGFSEVDGSDLELVATDPTTFTVLVSAQDPTITEGQDLRINGTIFDPDSTAAAGRDTYLLDIVWKDGTTQTVLLDRFTTAAPNGVTFDPQTRVFTVSHRYVDEVGTPSLTFNATRIGASLNDDVSTTVEISNAAPQVNLDPLFLDNNGNATLTGSYTDRGIEDSEKVTVQWKDGSGESVFLVAAASNLNIGDSFPQANFFSTAPSGPVLTITSVDTATGRVGFEVTGKSYAGFVPSGRLVVKVRDEDGAQRQKSIPIPWGFDLKVLDTSSTTINENGTARLDLGFTDDVTFQLALFGSEIPDQSYEVVVDWDDPNDPRVSTFDVRVDFHLTGSFLNPQLEATFTATNRFGDGAVLTSDPVNASFSLIDLSGSSFLELSVQFSPTFMIERRYLDDGAANGNSTSSDVSNIVVNIFEAESQGHRGGTVIRPVTVNNVAPILTLDPTAEVGVGGVAVLSGTMSDVGTLDALTLVVDWRDGSGLDLFSFAPSTQNFTVAHVYTTDLDGGSYDVAVFLIDDDRATTEVHQAIVVDFNKAPVAVEDVVLTNADQVLLIDVLADNLVGPDFDAEGNLDPSLTTLVSMSVSPTSASGLLTNNGDGTFTFDPTTAFASLPSGDTAIVTFRYQIKDTEAETDTARVTILIVGVNTQPVGNNQPTVSSISRTTDEDAGTFTIDLLAAGSAADVDTGDTLSLSALSLTSGRAISFAQNGNNLEFDANQFNDLAVGESETLVFDFSVSDNSGAINDTITRTVTLIVEGRNDGPVISVTNASVTVAEGTTAAINGSFNDVDLSDVVSITSSIGSIIQDSGNGGNWTWSFNTGDGPNDNQVVTITATDSQGATATQTFLLTVNNVAPTLTMNTTAVVINEGASVSKSITTSDVPADTVGVTASLGTITDNGGGNWTWNFSSVDDLATSLVTITASDGEGGVTIATFDLTVNNVAPTIALSGAASVNEGLLYTLTLGAVTDPGDDAVTSYVVDWDDGSSSEMFTIDGNVTHTYADGDSFPTINVDLVDEDGTHLGAGSLSLAVNNVEPDVAADIPEVTVDESETAVNSGTFSDLGDDVVTITASIGTITQVGTQSGMWTWSFGTSDGPNDSQPVTITATDSDGASGETVFVLTVNNVAPTANDASFDVVENSADGTSVGSVTASDPGDDTLTFKITGGTGATAFAIDLSGAITVADSTQLDFETTSSFTLEVTVTDDDGATDVANVTINLINQASITGTVFVDANQNGLYDANEMGIDDVILELLDEMGTAILDELGMPVTATTGDGGFYLFEDLDPGTYRVHEQQPTGVDDGAEQLGSLGGVIVSNDTMQLTLDQTDASDYVFAEIGQQVSGGDTATIGFWQNKHGQKLIAQGGTALAQWLTTNFASVFGNAFDGASGADVANFYKDQLFKQKAKKSAGPAKVDAQFMAVAFATYFTSSNLAGTVAAAFGFNVTDTGIGTKIVNVGTSGAAFGVADNTDLTIMQLLLATNSLTDTDDGISGFARIYDKNGDGIIDASEASLRSLANDIYSLINEQGDL